MTKKAGMTKSERRIPSVCLFVIRNLDLFCHSSFGFGHSAAAPPAEPPQRISHRVNLALFFFINDTNRNKFDFVPCRNEGQQHFRFNLKMSGVDRQRSPRPKLHQTEAALSI